MSVNKSVNKAGVNNCLRFFLFKEKKCIGSNYLIDFAGSVFLVIQYRVQLIFLKNNVTIVEN